MTKQKKTSRQPSPFLFQQVIVGLRQCGWTIWILILTLLTLSLVAGANFETAPKVYVAGQIADADVIADRDLLVEDAQATKARKKQVLSLQPAVYDLSLEPFSQFQTRVTSIFRSLNNPGHEDDSALSKLIEEISQPVADEILPALSRPNVQKFILKSILPQIRDQLAEGLVWDVRAARVGNAGMILRNLDNNTEVLRPEVHSLPDAQSFLAEISARLRQEHSISPDSRRAINIFLAATMPSSMTLNREATQKRSSAVVASVSPVYYQVQKGELLLRKGERVSREQQIKLQALYNSVADPIRWHIVAGAFICSFILSLGFFATPSGKPSRPLRPKDVLLISLILIIFSIGAKGVYLFGLRMDSISLLNSFAVAFPVAGAVGIVAMVFAARRYCTMGLLLAFFATLMFQGNYPLFFYYFLGGMLSTFLVTRAQNRQDVVWSVLPLTVGLLFIWSATALMAQSPLFELPMLITGVLINSLLSLIVLFALSPVLEMVFSYSTRFRLMELMSLEQPLMQEIMVTIPGTYHHSLVVANMVEAGAKAIGANSLLCKVAALYHDAGKLSYPEYFIENQFGAPNKHDKLAPSMSALILLSHVKKGTELADKYNLGQEITDIIRQHHGTRLMRFFYQKAINLGEKPQEAEYSYPGPRPQSKEAAILMLADSVEASSRTLTDPTPARIKNHIDKIIKGIFAEGQLDESELTFKDLHYLSENFQRILTGIFHQRIAYPETRLNAVRQVEKTAKTEKSEAKNETEAPAEGQKESPPVPAETDKGERTGSEPEKILGGFLPSSP